MKAFLLVTLLFLFIKSFAQSNDVVMKVHFRESWAKRYDIKINFTISVAQDSILVTRTTHDKIKSMERIDYAAFEKILQEVEKVETFQDRQNQFSDGNTISIEYFKNSVWKRFKISCIYPENNQEALHLIEILKIRS